MRINAGWKSAVYDGMAVPAMVYFMGKRPMIQKSTGKMPVIQKNTARCQWYLELLYGIEDLAARQAC